MNVYRLLADTVVVIHLAYVAFVVLGLLAILLGWLLNWRWVRNFWFRVIHFAMIGVVVLEALVGMMCPLTDWEAALREKAGETIQQGTFLGRLASNILFVDIPPKTLTWIYCLFGLAVLITLFCIPPRRLRGNKSKS
ncbi:MAG: DUF2784 domain-containing protein [Pirellulales bacterium]|nr:DUF2784 domain-containing protein [Pirellulales bacterium]